MLLSRLLLPLLCAFSLLFAQQAGAAHTLQHTLAGHQQQQDKQAPHNHNCEQCALDAQLGSTLHSDSIAFSLPLLPAATWLHDSVSFHHIHTLAASARGPPASLQQFA